MELILGATSIILNFIPDEPELDYTDEQHSTTAKGKEIKEENITNILYSTAETAVKQYTLYLLEQWVTQWYIRPDDDHYSW